MEEVVVQCWDIQEVIGVQLQGEEEEAHCPDLHPDQDLDQVTANMDGRHKISNHEIHKKSLNPRHYSTYGKQGWVMAKKVFSLGKGKINFVNDLISLGFNETQH